MDAIEKNRKSVCAVWRDLVDECGGANRVAGLLKISPAQVSKYGFDHYQEMPRIDHAMILERDCGKPLMSRFMCEVMGFALSPIEGSEGIDNIVAEMADAQQAMGEVSTASFVALADHQLDSRDAATIDKEASEAIEKLCNVRAAVRPLIGSGKVVPLKQTA